MGRESRQARRARERREQLQGRQGRSSGGASHWSLFVGLGFAVAAVLVLAGVLASKASTSAAGPGTPVATIPPVTPAAAVSGVGCTPSSQGEQLVYHRHMHLSFVIDGKTYLPPAYIGFSLKDCLFWLHSHNADGVIHLEAPRTMHPTLGTFFAVWRDTTGDKVALSRTQVWHWTVKPGQQMRVIVNRKIYNGNPANIMLGPHDNITIEIGPPFFPQKPFAWGNL